jgi:hypothetical protein
MTRSPLPRPVSTKSEDLLLGGDGFGRGQPVLVAIDTTHQFALALERGDPLFDIINSDGQTEIECGLCQLHGIESSLALAQAPDCRGDRSGSTDLRWRKTPKIIRHQRVLLAAADSFLDKFQDLRRAVRAVARRPHDPVPDVLAFPRPLTCRLGHSRQIES